MQTSQDDQAPAFTELQTQVVALRVNEFLTDAQIARRLKREPGQISKIMRLPKVADATLDATRAMLMSSSALAAKTLIDLLKHASGYVRAQAAQAVLDRAGVVTPKEPATRVKNVTINIGLQTTGPVAISLSAGDAPKRGGP